MLKPVLNIEHAELSCTCLQSYHVHVSRAIMYVFLYFSIHMTLSCITVLDNLRFNPIELRKAKIVYNFGLSECNRVKSSCKKGTCSVTCQKIFFVSTADCGLAISYQSVPGLYWLQGLGTFTCNLTSK